MSTGNSTLKAFRARVRTFGWSMLGLLLVACGTDKPPPGVLQPPEMVAVLQDLYIAEQMATELRALNDSVDDVFPQVEREIFSSHQINDSVFQVSYNYYMDHPDALEAIYAILLDSLNLKMEKSRSRSE